MNFENLSRVSSPSIQLWKLYFPYVSASAEAYLRSFHSWCVRSTVSIESCRSETKMGVNLQEMKYIQFSPTEDQRDVVSLSGEQNKNRQETRNIIYATWQDY